MKKTLFLILFLFNCLSVPQLKYEIKGGGDICDNKIGKDKVKCISNILDNYEKIINATPSVKVISSERFDEDIVIVVKKYCLEDLCFQVKEEVYDPTGWGKVKNYILTGSVSFFIGTITGFTIK